MYAIDVTYMYAQIYMCAKYTPHIDITFSNMHMYVKVRRSAPQNNITYICRRVHHISAYGRIAYLKDRRQPFLYISFNVNYCQSLTVLSLLCCVSRLLSSATSVTVCRIHWVDVPSLILRASRTQRSIIYRPPSMDPKWQSVEREPPSFFRVVRCHQVYADMSRGTQRNHHEAVEEEIELLNARSLVTAAPFPT